MIPRLTVTTLATVAVLVAGLGAGAARAGAQATPEASAAGSLPPVVWRLIAIESAGSPTLVPDDPARYTVQFLEDGSILVRADCNNGRGGYTVEGYALTIPPFAMTLAACPPPTLDSQFVAALSDVAAFAYARDTLVLTLGDGKGALVFVPSLTGVVWTWQELRGGAAPVSPDDPGAYTLTFGDDGKVALRADCNRGFGPFAVTGSQITIGPVATTRAACPPGSLSDQFVQAIEAAAAFTFAEGHLLLALPNDAGTLVFAARSAEAGAATPAAG
ncbi:MAG TPA: META domain-containing protein [Thermomicrobiales bacterium]|jgi:heat shock protein HslJ